MRVYRPVLTYTVLIILTLCPLGRREKVIAAETVGQPARLAGSSRNYSYYGKLLSWDEVKNAAQPFLDRTERQVIHLELSDCITRALENNLDIRIGRHDPAIKMTDVIDAEAAFDAVLFSSAQFQNIDQANIETGFFTRTIETASGSRQIRVPTEPYTRNQDYNYALGLRKRLPTGATLELAQRLRRFRTNETGLYLNPFYEYSFDLELRQPLLRDFGIDLNRASIEASRNNYRISKQQFHLLVIQTTAEVESNYWQLVFFRQRVKILENLLNQAQSTLARLEERTVLDAGSGVIARNRGLIERARADLVTARSDVLQQQDQLLETLNDPNLPLHNEWEIIPTDQPATAPYLVDRSQALATALKMRPELIAQQLQTDTAGIALGVAQNQLLPRLDLIARQEATGAGADHNLAWDGQQHTNTINYVLGLSFEVPLGNRAARAALVKAQREQQQTILKLASFREQIAADVSISVHTLENTFDEIAVRQKAGVAEADTLLAYLVQEDAEARVTADFLNRKLDAQERLARAHIVTAQTIFRFNVAIIDLQRAQGTLLRYNNIKLAELQDSPP